MWLDLLFCFAILLLCSLYTGGDFASPVWPIITNLKISRASRSFSLLELMAIIAVIAALIVGALYFTGGYVTWAKNTSDHQTYTVLNDALDRYKTQGGGLSGLTYDATIDRVIAQMQSQATWVPGMSHQFLDSSVTYHGRSIGETGTGTLNHATTTKRWFILSEWDFGSSEVDVNSGQININANTDIRFAIQGNTGTNVFNLNGGAVTFFSDNATTVGGTGVMDMHQGSGSTVNNSFNLNGGTLTVSAIISATGSGTRAFNFNGGTLKATAATANFMALGTGNAAANVRNGGAIINDGGFTVTNSQPLRHSAIAGDNATDGGLTKLGAGTLTLSGANTYNGTTTVSAGTLEVVQAVLATNAAVSIASGSVLQLDFATTNQVNALVLNGVSQAPGVYNSSTTPTYITGTGSLLVQAGPSGPAKLISSLSGNSLSLTWPAGQGWRLVGQTNSLSTGLNPSSAAWGAVPGVSDGSASISIDSTKPTVFYRLVYP